MQHYANLDAEGCNVGNTEETHSLKLWRPADLLQADVFYHLGHCTFLDAKLQPLIVNELLGARIFVVLTCDQLIHQQGKSKLILAVGIFLSTAYAELAVMVKQNIAGSGMPFWFCLE